MDLGYMLTTGKPGPYLGTLQALGVKAQAGKEKANLHTQNILTRLCSKKRPSGL